MKLFSDCSGECCLCGCGSGCLAGHGDDDFYPATKDQLIERLDKGEYPSYTQMMIDHLKINFGYIYDKKPINIKPVKSIKYVKVPLTKDDKIEPSPKTFTEMILEAQAEAFKEGIRANTIVINKNMVKVDTFSFQTFHDVRFIPPMICGMNVYVSKNDLPDGYSFAVFENPSADDRRLAQFESIGMEPDELRKAAEMYKRVKEIM